MAELRQANVLVMQVSRCLTPNQQLILEEAERLRKDREAVEALEEVHCADDHCAICFDDMDGADTVVKLPCGHCFHKSCATKWLTSQKACARCPLCNQKLSNKA